MWVQQGEEPAGAEVCAPLHVQTWDGPAWGRSSTARALSRRARPPGGAHLALGAPELARRAGTTLAL